ncbi:hypothetical protein LXL04_034715 [Taraxacum kok-saghyz]
MIKLKTGFVGRDDIDIHYEHPEMGYIIQMVDERDLKRLICVIQSVSTAVHIYVVERGNDGIERRSGEGSCTKRSSGRGSNDPSECPGPVSQPNCNYRFDFSQTIKKGQTFQTKAELIHTLCMHAIHEHKQFRTERSSTTRFSAKCIDESCPWHVTAYVVKNTQYFYIRKCDIIQTCSSTQLYPNHRQANKKVLARLVADVVTSQIFKQI